MSTITDTSASDEEPGPPEEIPLDPDSVVIPRFDDEESRWHDHPVAPETGPACTHHIDPTGSGWGDGLPVMDSEVGPPPSRGGPTE